MSAQDKLERFCEIQLEEWTHKSRSSKAAVGPVITISRQPGCGDEAIAGLLAGKLGLVLYDQEIVELIARNTKVSELVVATLDEKVRSELDSWMAELLQTGRGLSAYAYLINLKKVLFSIAAHGNAIILGRGGNFVIPPEKKLGLRLVAPLEARVKLTMEQLRLSERRARNHIAQTEREQRRFVSRHFGADLSDPLNYHLVINTALVKPEAILGMVLAMLNANS